MRESPNEPPFKEALEACNASGMRQHVHEQQEPPHKSRHESIHSGNNCFLLAAHPMEDFAAHACTHAPIHCMAASEQFALLSHNL